MEALLHDLRFAARTLLANARFTAAAVLTLALGIGATAAIFTVVNQVLLRPLPYDDSAQIYRVRTLDAQGLPQGPVMAAHIDALNERRGPVLAAAYGLANEASVVGRNGLPVAITEYIASDEFFRIFTDTLSLGRGFEPGDDANATVLSNRVWREQFDSDPNVIGSVVIGRTIVGVAAPDFDFPPGTGAWRKFYALGPLADVLQMDGYARLERGAAGEELQAMLDVVAGSAKPWQDGRPVRFVSASLLDDVVGNFSSTVLILFGAVAIVLMIACLNVAILLFTRGAARARELALRSALGARRWCVTRQLLTETCMLAVLGGTFGLGIAVGAVRLFSVIGLAGLPRLQTLSVDLNVLLFAAACVALTTLAVGLAPALRQARANLTSLINEGGRGGSGGPKRNRLFGTFVVAEVALAVVLVIGAALLVRSYDNLVSRDPGFNPERLLTVEINVPGRVDRETSTGYLPVARFYEELLDRIRALPGVESAGATSHAPLMPPLDRAPFLQQGEPFNPRDPSARPIRQTQVTRVSPEYFASIGTRAVAGRLFERSDGRDARGAVVVNEAFARFVYPDGNAVGQRIIFPGVSFWRPGGLAYNAIGEMATDEFDIVGVVPDVPQSTLWETPEPAAYFPLEQWTVRRMTLVIRTQLEDSGTLIPAVRAVVGELDATIPPEFAAYADVLSAAVARERLGAALLGAFGLASLLLAAVGIYGLMSYTVTQRSAEIAVRSALGARSSEMSRMIVAWALRLALAGTALGLAGAWALGKFVTSQLYGISASDPLVFVSVPFTILAVAVVSSYLPARRAARIDPTLTLRSE
jgi:putative ABC transport system permease protein